MKNKSEFKQQKNLLTIILKKDLNTYLLFHNPIKIISYDSSKNLDFFFDELQSAIDNEKWIAGYLTYEAGYYLEPFFLEHEGYINASDNSIPLIWFGVFDKPIEITDKSQLWNCPELRKSIQYNHISYATDKMTLCEDKKNYYNNVEIIRGLIGQGTVYQVNYGFKFSFKFTGEPYFLFSDLISHQDSAHIGYIDTGKHQIISLSPELFFEKKDNKMIVKPMKGTIGRGITEQEDSENYLTLKSSEKDKSENVMIVDLLRNDLGKIADVNTVRVTSLFEVEQYNTLFQMTSTIEAEAKKGLEIKQLFKSLYPCGSITGAPKIKAMEIIRKIEKERRGLFCGSLGFISPDNYAKFNVAIRTLCINDNGTGEIGVGSGITYDSHPEKEFQECILKSKFFTDLDFYLIETLLWDGLKKEYYLLEYHLKRLKKSALELDFQLDEKKIAAELDKRIPRKTVNEKVRVQLFLDGKIQIFSEPISTARQSKLQRIKISEFKVDKNDAFLRHKTSRRNLYDLELKRGQSEGVYDVVFMNTDGEVTEGCFNNILIRKKNTYYTPPLKCGLLPGVYREHVLNNSVLDFPVFKKILRLDDLKTADAIFLMNSVRGMVEVVI